MLIMMLFILIAGAQGRVYDGGIWAACILKQHIVAGSLNIPPTCMLPNTNIEMPLHIVGDDAFPLCKVIMKPYSRRNLEHGQQVFNYRLSRARRIVENVFGILPARFRVFHSVIPFNPIDARYIVQACVILHNILNRKNTKHYLPPGMMLRMWCIISYLESGEMEKICFH